jgi:hypothetical protein
MEMKLERRTSLNAQLSGRDLLLLLACSSFSIFSLLLLLFLLLDVLLVRVSASAESRIQSMGASGDGVP